MPPHPFDVADSAYKTLLDVNRNQSILVSGESGAGKTEVTKQCLMFLAEVAGSKANIEQRVLSVNPILEAFGNAKTLRNDNSSRFGRFSEIILDQDKRIAGAQIHCYLLEKSRVSYQQSGERNYHIFYQLCRSSLAAYYGLGGPDYYGYLAHSGSCDIKGVDDAKDFDEVCRSMDSLGFTAEEKHSIFSIISGIIQLGNITFSAALFKGHDGGTADGSTIDDVNAANAVAVQLGCDPLTLQNALTHRTLDIMGQAPITVPLRTDQAIENRDAVAKYVYEKVFHWLVAKINQSLAPSGQKTNFIGILDIFGFEIFKQNSFEQLCINFCNEKLQQLFNEDTFKNEETVYKRECVAFPPIVFIDNQPVVDLIEMRGGIFTVLDDVVKAPGKPESKDAKFGTTLDANFKANPVFVASSQHRGISYTAFSINHYAGTVMYDVDKFVEKNKDSLFSDLYDMMAKSDDPLIKCQFAAPQGARRTLASEFKSQLSDLMKELRATESHFIRCIKANSEKKPRVFDGASCLEQLKCAGVFEAVAIRKNGYPFRYSFQRFVERYKCIMATDAGWMPFQSREFRDQCREIIATSRQSFPNMQWGSTMLFFRADEYKVLELCRALATDRTSSKIQAMARGRLTRRYVKLVQACRPRLRAACASRDAAQLEAALEHVNAQLGAFAVFSISVPVAEWANAKELLGVIREAIRLEPEMHMWLYSDLEQDNNFEMLFKVYKSARLIAPKHPNSNFDELYKMVCDQVNGWRDYRLKGRFDDVMRSLERDEMGSLYAECNRLEFEDQRLAEIEKLMGLGAEALIKMQYKRALETGQAQRVIMKEIELRELCLEHFHDNFLFENCSLLRDPVEYAAAKLVSFHRDELQQGFYVHSVHALRTSMTRLQDSDMVKDALVCFRFILGYCGDKPSTYPESNAVKVLQLGIDGNDQMRAEIFAQLMKQCNQNPNPESLDKAWELAMLCLLHFAPGETIENFVQVFIRDNCPGRVKDAMVKQCHQSVYSSRAQAPPAVNMISSLLKQNGF
jgi:ABC-type oligopeptide transport system ATPase subunit